MAPKDSDHRTTSWEQLAADIKDASPDALSLVMQISTLAGEIARDAERRVSHFPPDLRKIVMDAVIRRLT